MDYASGRLAGATSFGSGQGCEKGLPTAFTRISVFHDWILSITGPLDV